MMPFGVDVLGTLSEKLKQLMNETQANQRLFIDLTKLYKEDRINEKDFFSKILNYVVTVSALNFLKARAYCACTSERRCVAFQKNGDRQSLHDAAIKDL